MNEVSADVIQKNKELVEKYHFLWPRSMIYGHKIQDYDYSFTMLDEIPEGWKRAFGEQLCMELKEALVSAGEYDEYQVVQAKEKWGYLHWYDNGGETTREIVRKYEDISEGTCCRCGAKATKISRGWVNPFCTESADELTKKRKGYITFDDITEE